MGHRTEGVEMLREGLKDWIATDSVTYQTYYLGLLAEMLAGQGRSNEGLRVLEEALNLVQQTGERLYEAELYRLRGELLLYQPDPTESHAESARCFEQALEIARRQQAVSFELRAAVSLARLAHRMGRTAEALAVLEPACKRLTEGYNTPDYRDATALLVELH